MTLNLYRVQADCTWDADHIAAAYYVAENERDAVRKFIDNESDDEHNYDSRADWHVEAERVPVELLEGK